MFFKLGGVIANSNPRLFPSLATGHFKTVEKLRNTLIIVTKLLRLMLIRKEDSAEQEEENRADQEATKEEGIKH